MNPTKVLVLGGSGQLGQRIAAGLAAAGAQVLLAGRDRDRLEAAAESVPGASVLEFGLRKPHDFPQILDQAVGMLDGLDGVVNAAGVVGFGSLTETPEDALAELVQVDFVGPVQFMRIALPLLPYGGFWVNITGVVAEQPRAGLAPYSAAKAGLSAATRAVARELRRDGVRVVDVRPGHTETGLANRAITGQAPTLPQGLDPDQVAARIVATISNGERSSTRHSSAESDEPGAADLDRYSPGEPNVRLARDLIPSRGHERVADLGLGPA